MITLVITQEDEDGHLIEEISFEIGRYPALDSLLGTLKKMSQSNNINEISRYYSQSLTHINEWALDCWASAAANLRTKAFRDTEEARIRAKGGI